jgi:putative peptide zinc metalloprotease protein
LGFAIEIKGNHLVAIRCHASNINEFNSTCERRLLADPAGLAEDAATRQRLNVQLEETRATRNEIARLNLQAPFAGSRLDLNPDWQPGQWIGRQEPLGILVDPRSWQVDAYVAQGQIHHIAVNDPVRFYPEGQTAPLSGRVLAIGSTRTGQLAHRMLSSHFGGPVQVTAQDPMVPGAALFQVLMELDQPLRQLRETRGHLKIEGERRSVLGELGRWVLGVGLKESGF